jgi:DNA-binding SARP family transcriptional activator
MIEQGDGPPPRRLYEMSRGWAAGLILLNEASRKEALPHAFTEKEMLEVVFDYFATEVFRHLDPKTQDFFLTTAFLPKMTVQMAKRLTGNKSAGNILGDLNRNNYFVMRRSGLKITYEYHPLYRQFLLNLAEEEFSPDRLSNVRRDAAVLMESEGMTEEAIGLLKEIAGWDIMVGIILGNAPDMIKQGRYLPLQDWLGTLPDPIKKDTPWLLYWEGVSRLPYSPVLAKPVFENAFDRFQIAGDTIGAMLAASGVITAVLYLFDDVSPFDHWYSVLNHLAHEMEEMPNVETEAWVVSSMVIAGSLRGLPFSDMEFWETRAMNLSETPETLNIKVHAVRLIFWRRLFWKGCHAALPLLQELRRLSKIRYAHPLISITVQSSEVIYSMLTGLHDELVSAARKGLELAKQTGIHMEDMWFILYTSVSFTDRADEKSAKEWLDQISPWTESMPNGGRSLYHLQLMRISMIRSEYDQALHEGEKALDFAIKGGNPLPICSIQLLLSQLHFRVNNHREASMYLEQARTHAVEGKSNQSKIEVLRIEALFAFDCGDESKGFQFLERSLALARQCGYFCNLFDDPVTTIGLLEKALEANIEVAHVQKMIRRRGLVPPKPPIHLENWPWYFRIYTLGRFSIVGDGTPLRASGKAQQMPLRLLKALIALGGREVPVNTLSGFLWPDADGDQAHQSFGTTLHRLRKLLGRAEVITLNDGKLTLDSRYCWVDIWAFERFMGQVDEFVKGGVPEKAWIVTEKALGLYKNHFLFSEGEESWIIPPAERLKSKYFKRLLQIGRAMEQAGQAERAVQLYEKGLEVDDCSEELYRRLMVHYRNLGKMGEALALYERCRKLLSNSLGIAPSPETEAVREALLSRSGHLRVVHTENRPRQ